MGSTPKSSSGGSSSSSKGSSSSSGSSSSGSSSYYYYGRTITTGDWVGIGFGVAAVVGLILLGLLIFCGIVGCSALGDKCGRKRKARKERKTARGEGKEKGQDSQRMQEEGRASSSSDPPPVYQQQQVPDPENNAQVPHEDPASGSTD